MSFENAFRDACDRHEHLKLLESQWRFDKELISKALQNIGSLFPHYSRHDASHSRQIIINIERILGSRVTLLSATDMWLILEAAYNHDIGMVITHKQIQDLDTPEFKIFVQDMCDRPDHDLQPFAKKWIDGSATLPIGSAAHLFFNEYRQLLAEWYRRKHPENSAKIVNDPFDEIGLSSPRNELLPKRLFSVLAAICDAHGQPFENVMKLPFSEAGMATEDCHPRYVAFLLRMGDLLDVDDNRFCPVMMRMSGDSLPAESHSHFEKHRSIRHFRLDEERIQVEVVCPSHESYEVAHDWFKWLEKEYHNQSQHWPEIVPNEKLGRLPTLTPPKVTLAAPYLIINEGQRPSFDLNRDSILKLLRSTGLYSSKMDSIREILQNAVDSTIVAIWEKHRDVIVDLDPSDQRLFDIYDKHMIEVDFVKNENDSRLFTLIVKDSGIGIGVDDLRHMLKIGSSSKNKKSRMIRNMPDWFKPSGNFGIGLQSIYLLAEKFTITTRSRFTHESLHLTFTTGKGSSVVIKQLPPESANYGATVAVDIKFEDFPQSISISAGSEADAIREQINDYDFTEPGSDLKAYEKARVFSAIQSFNYASPIKIRAVQQPLETKRDIAFFSKKTNISLSHISFHYSDHLRTITLFRGQEFKDLHSHMSLISLVADFHGHQAMEFLTYNREKILPDAKHIASAEIKATVIEYIEIHFEEIREDERPCAAACYALLGGKNLDRYMSELMKFKIEFVNKPVSTLEQVLKAIAAADIVNIVTLPNTRTFLEENKSTIEDTDLWVLKRNGENVSSTLIEYFGTKQNNFWQERDRGEYRSVRYWAKDDIQPVSDEIFKRVMSGKVGFLEIGKRILFPAWGKYRKLSILAEIGWHRKHAHHSFHSDYLVLPYKFDAKGNRTVDTGENLLNWVYLHRKNTDVSMDQLRAIYADLEQHIEKIIGT
jgi:hypothetical protein